MLLPSILACYLFVPDVDLFRDDARGELMVDEPFRCWHLHDGGTEVKVIHCAVWELVLQVDIEPIQGLELAHLVRPHLAELLSPEPAADDCSAELF